MWTGNIIFNQYSPQSVDTLNLYWIIYRLTELVSKIVSAMRLRTWSHFDVKVNLVLCHLSLYSITYYPSFVLSVFCFLFRSFLWDASISVTCRKAPKFPHYLHTFKCKFNFRQTLKPDHIRDSASLLIKTLYNSSLSTHLRNLNVSCQDSINPQTHCHYIYCIYCIGYIYSRSCVMRV